MKTPMQELLEWVRATLPMDLDTPRMIEQKIESMLEKEKEVITEEQMQDWIDNDISIQMARKAINGIHEEGVKEIALAFGRHLMEMEDDFSYEWNEFISKKQ